MSRVPKRPSNSCSCAECMQIELVLCIILFLVQKDKLRHGRLGKQLRQKNLLWRLSSRPKCPSDSFSPLNSMPISLRRLTLNVKFPPSESLHPSPACAHHVGKTHLIPKPSFRELPEVCHLQNALFRMWIIPFPVTSQATSDPGQNAAKCWAISPRI